MSINTGKAIITPYNEKDNIVLVDIYADGEILMCESDVIKTSFFINASSMYNVTNYFTSLVKIISDKNVLEMIYGNSDDMPDKYFVEWRML